jgi:hypothetical protein
VTVRKPDAVPSDSRRGENLADGFLVAGSGITPPLMIVSRLMTPNFKKTM